MANHTDPIDSDIETPTISARLWAGFLELMTLVGMLATVSFVAGAIVSKQPSSVTQCEPTKTVLARSIFK